MSGFRIEHIDFNCFLLSFLLRLRDNLFLIPINKMFGILSVVWRLSSLDHFESVLFTFLLVWIRVMVFW